MPTETKTMRRPWVCPGFRTHVILQRLNQGPAKSAELALLCDTDSNSISNYMRQQAHRGLYANVSRRSQGCDAEFRITSLGRRLCEEADALIAALRARDMRKAA